MIEVDRNLDLYIVFHTGLVFAELVLASSRNDGSLVVRVALFRCVEAITEEVCGGANMIYLIAINALYMLVYKSNISAWTKDNTVYHRATPPPPNFKSYKRQL